MFECVVFLTVLNWLFRFSQYSGTIAHFLFKAGTGNSSLANPAHLLRPLPPVLQLALSAGFGATEMVKASKASNDVPGCRVNFVALWPIKTPGLTVYLPR